MLEVIQLLAMPDRFLLLRVRTRTPTSQNSATASAAAELLGQAAAVARSAPEPMHQH
jgi:hypothetical protein